MSPRPFPEGLCYMTSEKLMKYWDDLTGKEALQVLAWSRKEFGPGRVMLASSFSIEDQVLTHMLSSVYPPARIFTLDTGRQFQETYDVMQRTMEKYRVHYEVGVPTAEEVAALLADAGPNAMYRNLADRVKCCAVRKMRPLAKILKDVDVWICGLRRDQAQTRTETDIIEWDGRHGTYKISPLADWSEGDVWRYIKDNDVPYNALYDQGFRSIGCAPCTRAVGPGEDIRAGRWWWEEPEHRECGLHEKR